MTPKHGRPDLDAQRQSRIDELRREAQATRDFIATTRGRQVARFQPRAPDKLNPSARMRSALDSPRGRALYSRRIATVEPVFANIRHHKRISRFTLRSKTKVSTQWQLYCLVAQRREDRHAGDASALKGKTAAHLVHSAPGHARIDAMYALGVQFKQSNSPHAP